eukprot:EG_transcript_37967
MFSPVQKPSGHTGAKVFKRSKNSLQIEANVNSAVCCVVVLTIWVQLGKELGDFVKTFAPARPEGYCTEFKLPFHPNAVKPTQNARFHSTCQIPRRVFIIIFAITLPNRTTQSPPWRIWQ